MGRTGELTRATLDTADNILILCTLPVLDLRDLGKEIRLETHRTSTDALGTTDTRLWLLTTGFIVGDNSYRVGSLTDGHLSRCEGLTHHRTTCQQFVITLRHTATGIDKILHRCSHTNEEVAWISKALTCYGGVTLKERLALHHCLIDSEGSTYVLNDGTHIHWDGWRCRNLTTDNGIDELFLTALRITLLQRNNLYFELRTSELLCTFLCEQFDGSGFVGLDTDITRGDLSAYHQELKTNENLIGMLHHQTEVGSDIWLALYGIDNHALCLCRWRRSEFYEGGETSTTHTYYTSVLDTTDNLLGS